MAKGDDIQDRLVRFAVGIIRICASLPRNEVGHHLASQLLRCGTSPAANYGEARGGESVRDFIHKLGIVLKELNESSIWLRIIAQSGLCATDRIAPLNTECVELSKIIAASIRTARSGQSH